MFWKITSTFALAGGIAIGFYGRALYDEWAEPDPLSIGGHFNGIVTDVYDADTMTIDDAYKIRIWGIDAPERSQRCLDQNEEIVTCGLQARDELRELVLGKELTCEIKDLDGRYDRFVASCTLDNTDPIATIVREGWAFSDTQYSDNPYGTEQKDAQRNLRGIWNMEIMVPKEWRACLAYNRGGAQPPETCLKPLGPITPR